VSPAIAFTHVFAGDNHRYQPDEFFSDLDAELAASPRFHLWAEIPLCRYRCNFCEFPILVLATTRRRGRRWRAVGLTPTSAKRAGGSRRCRRCGLRRSVSSAFSEALPRLSP